MKSEVTMSDYILGAVLVVLFILAARSYFGKKYSGDGCCNGCSGCAHAKQCGMEGKRKG